MKLRSHTLLFLIPVFLLALWWSASLSLPYSSTFPVPPSFSNTPGFYDSSFGLSLFTSEGATQIHYTLDGSEPSKASPVFTMPIPIKKTTVVKAIVLGPGGASSKPETGTFLINENIAPGLPVISLSTDSLILFDTIDGYYTRGPMAKWNDPSFLQNYWQRVEFPMYFEYFDLGGERMVAQAAGARIFGNTSREVPQKSFRIAARKKYGKNRFEHNFFPNKDLYSFKALTIRNSGTDWNDTQIRDAFIHDCIGRHTFLDTQASRSCVVFINGKYWGVYNLREHINKSMIASNHGLSPDFINVVENSDEPKEGSSEGFMALSHFVDSNDLALPANYDFVKAKLDLNSLTDYWAVEVWAANWDWMHHNVRIWSDLYTNSPWRYILWDMDMGMGSLKRDGQSHLQINLQKNWTPHVRILKALLKNEHFKVYFVNRHADLLNTLFAPEPLLAKLQAMVDLLSPEMPRHFDTWGDDNLNLRWGKKTRGSYDDWLNHKLNNLRYFINVRQQTARNEFQEGLGLNDQHRLYLQVYPPEAGKIQVNTVEITSFPWQGIYFEGIPVSLTALPNPGYTFDYWQNDKGAAELHQTQSFEFNISMLDSLSAHFSGFPETPILTVNEIKTQSSGRLDAGDWVELYNPGTVPFDLRDWRLKDAQDKNQFVFPPGTSLAPDAYLVVVQDTAAFSSVFPEVHPVVGPFSFGLKKTQDQVRLFSPKREEYLRISYRNESPWPQIKSTENASLELIDPSLNPASPTSWRKRNGGGSPGRANLSR